MHMSTYHLALVTIKFLVSAYAYVMATQDKSGFQKAESPNETPDDDAIWVDRPQEGESLQGILLERTPEAGKYNTPLYKMRRTDDHPDDEGPVVLMWANATIDNVVEHNDLGPGDELLIEATETYTFEDSTGTEQQGTDFEVYFK